MGGGEGKEGGMVDVGDVRVEPACALSGRRGRVSKESVRRQEARTIEYVVGISGSCVDV